jgi:hypothetical protein
VVSDEQLRLLRSEKPSDELPAWTKDPATPPQIGYIKGLVESRDIPESWLLRIKELTEAGLTKGDAGKIISALKGRPLLPGQDDRSKNNPTVEDIPPGRYAVPNEHSDNDIAFYRIRENKERKNKYVVQIIGPNETYLGRAPDVVKKIVRYGIGNAAVLYGRTIGRCSQCNTRITNRISRELGIGPVCGGRVYDDWGSRVANAETALRLRGLDPRENV